MFYAYALFLLAGVCLPPRLVSAALYPTEPVQATVWQADVPMDVSWTEDGKRPALRMMGALDITLWCNTDTFLAPLASNVDPMGKTCQVTVPGSVLQPGSTYTLRFTTRRPIDMVIYSADFVIVPANGTTWSIDGPLATPNGTGSVTMPTTAGTLFPWTTMTTMTTTTTTAAWSSPSTTSLGTTATLSGSDGASGGATPTEEGQRAASAGQRGLDVEKLKFRFVFVMWPVLMGIAMAL